MNREILNKAVIETLGFNPEEMKYKMLELQTELQELRDTFERMRPIIGATVAEFQILKGFLGTKKLDPDKYIEEHMAKLMSEHGLAKQEAIADSTEKVQKKGNGKRKN